MKVGKLALGFLIYGLMDPHVVLAEPLDTGAASGSRRIDDIVVTAARTETRRGEIGSSVTVITGEELQRRKDNSVLEMLRNELGVGIVTSGGAGTSTQIRMRGLDATATLVLLDGVRIHSNTSGTAEIQNLTIDNIDRIEIVRGPQSTLYGSDAMGGVIQIFTKKGTSNASSIAYEGGSYQTHLVRASTQHVSEKHSLSVGGSWLQTEGFSTFNELRGGVEDDGYRDQALSVNYQAALPWFDAGVIFRHTDGEHDNDATGADNRTRFSKSRDNALSFKFSRAGTRWDNQILLTGFENDIEGNSGTDFRIISASMAAELQSEYKFEGGHSILVGGKSEEQRGENKGNFNRTTIINSGFAQAMANVRNMLHLSFGGRHDNHSEFGDATTWRATAGYTGLRQTRVFGSYGTGFKAPTFNQLFFPGAGNPALKPEESEGWDVGVERHFGDRFRAQVTWFDNKVSNFIQFVTGTGFTSVPGMQSHGLEASANWFPLDNLELSGGYTYTDARDRNNNLFLARVPENVATGRIAYSPTPSIDFDLHYRYTGHSYSSANERSHTAQSHVFGSVLSYKRNDRHNVWLRVENIFDEEYEDNLLFGTPLRSFYGGYEFRF